MTSTDFVAWWGATIATFVAIWDIVKWKRSGAKVVVSATPHMQEHGPGADPSRLYIFVAAVNTGGAPATLTHCVGYWYSNWFKMVARKPDNSFVVVNNAGLGAQLPHEVSIGQQWTGGIDQHQVEEKNWHKSGHFCVGVVRAGKKRPVLARVKFRASARIGRKLRDPNNGKEQ